MHSPLKHHLEFESEVSGKLTRPRPRRAPQVIASSKIDRSSGGGRSGRLVQILPEYVHQKADILAVYPDRRNLAPKSRAFIEFLGEHLSGLAESRP